ncbi:MAG: TraB/GumN family protein [Acidobacteriota bacterium]
MTSRRRQARIPHPQYEPAAHETAPPVPETSGRVEPLSKKRLMLRAVRLAACMALVAGQANAAAARDFLWKVSGTTGSLYLVGSVHLLTRDFYPLSPALENAFKESDLLVEEADLAEMLSPAAQMQMLARGMLPANTALDGVVSPATFDLVVTRAKELGLPIEPLKRFKPWSLALMLSQLQWQKAGFDGELGLDRHFYDQARADGKQVQGFETVEFQISRLDGIAIDQQERILAETLKNLDSELSNLTTLVQAWKVGDAATVERIVLADVKQEPVLYQRLLVERNRTWMPEIEKFFARARPAFVVVGAAHLVGPDGLIALLSAKGYRVEQP